MDELQLKGIDFGLSLLYNEDKIKKQNGQITMTTRPGRVLDIQNN
jgi:hypothetical protein